jgi:hypothetical protein
LAPSVLSFAFNRLARSQKTLPIPRRLTTMNNPCLSFSLIVLAAVSALPVYAGKQAALCSPEPGVLCGQYICANDKGLSRELMKKYLDYNTATKKLPPDDLDLTSFTFSNGISCDVKERLCREDRYYGADGKRSGAVNKKFLSCCLTGDSASSSRLC